MKKEVITIETQMSNDDRASVRWRDRQMNQLSYVNKILIILTIPMLGIQIQFGFNKIVQSSSYKIVFIASMLLFFISIIVGIYCAWNRLKDFRITSKITRNKEKIEGKTKVTYSEEQIKSFKEENIELRKKSKRLGKRTWKLLTTQALLFGVGAILLFGFALLEML